MTEHLENWLVGLAEFIVLCDSDLTKFHLQCNEVKSLLAGHGRRDLNFMKHLWCSYKVCKDFEFMEYMHGKKQNNNDKYPKSALTIDELIRSASNIYTLCTCKDNHVCGSKSPENSEIVDLKAEVGQLKGNQL